MKNWQIPRRTFLKGVGTALALPWLEAISPLHAAAPALPRPLRMAFVYVPNGVNMDDWTPATAGADFTLPKILEPLAPVRSELQILSGLAHRMANPNGDGAGDHARASASFLTGVQARKTAAMDVRAGISVDQIAATHVGNQTRLPSLENNRSKTRRGSTSGGSGVVGVFHARLNW